MLQKFQLIVLLGLGKAHVGLAQKPVAIGTQTPHSSAMLELSSSNKGMLPPRLTFTERNAIASPVAGLIIWCSNCGVKGEMQVFDGVEWKSINSGSAKAPGAPRITDNANEIVPH